MHNGSMYEWFGSGGDSTDRTASVAVRVAELLGVRPPAESAGRRDPGLGAYPQTPASEGTPRDPDPDATPAPDTPPADPPPADAPPPSDKKPVSARKLAANRANAARSTGPRTDAGKAAAKLNAVKHGLWAATSLLPGESSDELADLATEFEMDHAGGSAVERALAARAVAISWRLRRLARAEEWVVAEAAVRHERARGRMAAGDLAPQDWPDGARVTADDFVAGGAAGRLQQLMAAEGRLSGQLTTVCRLLLKARECGGTRGRP